MNILYLTNTRFSGTPYRDASTRYRCYHYAESLIDRQVVADVGVIDIIDTDIVERYDVVVVLRPSYDRKLVTIANICKKNNIVFVADFDDLVFVPELARESPIVRNNQATEEQIQAVFKKHKETLNLFDLFTVATQQLLWRLQETVPGSKILHLPNGLSQFWLKFNQHYDKNTSHVYSNQASDETATQKQSLTGNITYMPGTRSHDHDFASIQDAMANAVNPVAGRRLQIIGALDCNESLYQDGKLHRGSWRDYFDLPELIVDSWLTIAPLAKTEFNNCKSHVKFIESAAFGTPHISSNYSDVSQHEVTGLAIAKTGAEWIDAIQAFSDPEYYRHCSDSLRNYVLNNCMADQHVDNFLNFVQPSDQVNNEYSVSLPQAR